MRNSTDRDQPILPSGQPGRWLHKPRSGLISAGYDIAAVSKALGHSSVQITSKIYTALFSAAKAKMAGKAEDLVWKDRAT